tara:strand:+ start:3026 stop:4018 length:993 start_codon:yes stop_codon:yes gene_type:complete
MISNILITGGCGFIGSHLVRHFTNKYRKYNIINLDFLTYAANFNNLQDLKQNNYQFIKGDICNRKLVMEIFEKYKINKVIHLAAESHVDRSIKDPILFAKTNVIGTLNLLEAARESWKDSLSNKLFYHISTDEVFGSLGISGQFDENSSYDPHSPYSASKASSDHFVRSYTETYKLPTIISNCSNNYGPNQYPEKLIPLFVNNIIRKKKLPIYGNGENVRDWLHVKDHISAIDTIFHKGELNESYNIGGENEWKNIDLIYQIIKITDRLLNNKLGFSKKLIRFIKDREGHDYRYAINNNKIKKDLGWKPMIEFNNGLEDTIKWYIHRFNS